jgi:uncharacterized metal-binding protein YceD (DUF177 family)
MIKFRGLSMGIHRYSWQIDKKFFEAFENTEFIESALTADLDLEKQERMMILHFNIRGNVTVSCDRCLEDLVFNVDVKESYFIKFGTERKEESEDVIVITDSEYQVDVSTLVNEYITLSLPIRKVHEPDEKGNSGCNEEVIKKIEELSVKKGIDHRWDQLRNIKLE